MLSVTATNPSVLVYILAFTGLACVLSLAAVAGYLLLPERYRDLSLGHFVSFATGTLLGVAFLDLLPQALALNGSRGAERIMVVVLVGIFVFFILEKALIWRHAHHLPGAADHHHHHHGANAGALIMVGDTFHNFLDGILLTAVFVTDVQLGIVTGIAVIAHEIPQELGDFAIMLRSGFPRLRAFALNALSSVAMIVGALVAWWWIDAIKSYLPDVLAFTSASFIYIAVADLIPSLHRGVRLRDSLAQMILMVCGVAAVVLLHGAG